MKGYVTDSGYMGCVDGRYVLFASESDYVEYTRGWWECSWQRIKKGEAMKKIYFSITGTKYRYGHDFLKPGMKVKLEKEPDNQYDAEAIRVMMKGFG